MMAQMLSYGISFEAWTLFPDKQQTTRDLNQHVGYLRCNTGLYPDITATIVTYCKWINNLLQTADETITMPADVQVITVHIGYMWNYANAAVLRVTDQQTTLNPMTLMLPTPTLTPRLNCNTTPTLPMMLPLLLSPELTPESTPKPPTLVPTPEPTPKLTPKQTTTNTSYTNPLPSLQHYNADDGCLPCHKLFFLQL